MTGSNALTSKKRNVGRPKLGDIIDVQGRCDPTLPKRGGREHKKMRSRQWLRAGALAAVLSVMGAGAQGETPVVGSILEVNVFAFGTPPQGAKSPKYPHNDVVGDETLETVPHGGLVARLLDDTLLTLGGDARLVIDEMVYDPASGAGTAIFKLAAGAYHYASGRMHKEGIRIETPTATIGVRGTKLAINVAADGTTTIGVVAGEAEVTSKESGDSAVVEAGKNVSVAGSGQIGRITIGVPPTGDPLVDLKIAKELKEAAKAAEKAAKQARAGAKKSARAIDKAAKKGAYILSLTGRFAGYRSSRLSCNAVAEGWFFRSWAVVLRSCRLMRARNCRLSI